MSICPRCKKAEMIFNHKTGKWFCKDKCWLKEQQSTGFQPVQQPNVRYQTGNDIIIEELQAGFKEINERLDRLGEYLADKLK